jgi:hypothetical protein
LAPLELAISGKKIEFYYNFSQIFELKGALQAWEHAAFGFIK